MPHSAQSGAYLNSVILLIILLFLNTQNNRMSRFFLSPFFKVG
jgi:hypothetical protein